MSPEQCRGVGEITGKSDVYSLGVMLYELVSGRPPMVAEAMGELIAMHLYMVPTPLHELDATLPAELTQLIHAMLAKNPDERPTMTGVVQQLEQLGANRSIPPILPLHAAAPAGGDKSIPPSPSWPDVVAGMLATPTTLRAAAGQLPASPKPASRPSRAAIAVIAAGVLGLARVGSLQWARRSAPAAGASAPGPAPPVAAVAGSPASAVSRAAPEPRVRWHVTSEPKGARVVRARDGQELGTTPWQTERPKGPEKEALLLKLPGFVDQSLELSQSADVERHEPLRPTPRAATPEPRTRAKRRGASPGEPTKKPASEELSDDELRIVK